MGAHAGRLAAQIVSRGKGHSAVSKAAYNARTSLENDRLGTRDDYSRKNAECLFSGIYAPAKSPDWTRDREQLWNHVEAFEKRKDAQLARELVIDLPHELSAEQSRWWLQDFIKENFTRKGMVCDLAIHAPHRHSDERNIHAHLLIVLRKLDGTEFAAAKTRQTYAENVAELDGWKRSLEQYANKALTRHGHEARWDLRSNADRGLDREPEIHLGKAAAALERQGIETAPGNVNREIRGRNQERAAANENDRGEWIQEQIAEAEASTLPELEAVQRDRDRVAAEARAELEAEIEPQHRDAQPVISRTEVLSILDAFRQHQAREGVNDTDRQARRAIEELARTDPHGMARHFGHQAGRRRAAGELAAERKPAETQQDIARDPALRNLAQDPELKSATPEPVHLVAQSRDQVDDAAAYAARRQTALEEAERIREALHAENTRRQQEAVQQPARERERESTPEQPRTPEPPIQALEKDRPSLFQALARTVRSWFQPKQEMPQPDRSADRQDHDAGADRQADHAYTPAPAPARTPPRQPAPQRERPATRMVRSIADDMLAEARAELAAERARETAQQRADRELREAEQSRGRGDGIHDRTRHRHSLLWELLHPFHDHRRRDHHQP